jgi:hypothetical protein
MTIRDLGPVDSSTAGIACDLDLMIMSTGFSITTSMEGIFDASFLIAAGGGDLLIALPVISANGVLSRCRGSGEVDGAGVGSGGGMSGIAEVRRLARPAAALFRLRGDALLDGDVDSLGAVLSSGSNICDGSMPSPVFALRLRAFFVGDVSTFAVVCRREVFLGLRFRAGVNSSSSGALKLSSSSDSSTMMFFRVARRVGRVGETVAMLALVGQCRDFSNFPEPDAFLRKTYILIGHGAKISAIRAGCRSSTCGSNASDVL